MSDRSTDRQPSTVRNQELEHDGQTAARWGWVERKVWTERMLEALERGVRGGKWHSLYDKVYGLSNLKEAWKRVEANRGGGGVDRMSVADFAKDAEARLEKLSEALRSGTYKPQPVKRTYIPKPGSREKRPLGIPTIIDRIVQTALRNVIEPIFEREFEPCSYGFRPARGCQDALAEIERLLAAGYMHVVDVDLRKYFDTIPHQGLMNEVGKRIADGRVLDLIEAYLHQGILEEMKLWMPETGTPQGAVISPLLANVYLHPVDLAMRQAGFQLVRYADDMVVLCRTREEAEAALIKLKELVEGRGLQLHPDKTRIAHLMERPGFQFLGYVFYDRYRDPRSSSQDKLKASLHAKTKLTNGHSLMDIIAGLNASLRGWYNYFKFCSPTSRVWARIDRWIRYRLRAILDKRRRKGRSRNRGRGYAHYRWPNAYFTEHGLFSLLGAVKLVRQS
jgi:RNA-directed DNA polymerase